MYSSLTSLERAPTCVYKHRKTQHQPKEPKDHVNSRILLFGSIGPKTEGMPETMVCRILMSTWSLELICPKAAFVVKPLKRQQKLLVEAVCKPLQLCKSRVQIR